MLEELEKLIEFIKQEHKDYSERWKESSYYSKINFKKKIIRDIKEDNMILKAVFDYREFMNGNNMQLIIDFMHFNKQNNTVNMRTKARNSIEFKIKNFIDNHEKGQVPINKCFNDLLGIRFIYTDNISDDEIINFVNNRFKQDKLKCIKSQRQEYKAIHIYFKEDNFSFPWELQIWNKCDEENNILSHKKYKQEYVKWEQENKGGKK